MSKTSSRRLLLIAARTLLGFALIGVWVGWFLPQRLGGRADFVGVDGVSMTPTLHNGDLAVVERHEAYHVGDVIAYRIPDGELGAGSKVIHRIVGGNGVTGFTTKGDHNTYPDYFWHPKTADIVGRVWFHVPGLAVTFANLHRPVPLAVVVGVGSLLLFLWPGARKPGDNSRSRDPDHSKARDRDGDGPDGGDIDDPTLEAAVDR